MNYKTAKKMVGWVYDTPIVRKIMVEKGLVERDEAIEKGYLPYKYTYKLADRDYLPVLTGTKKDPDSRLFSIFFSLWAKKKG